MTNTVTDTLSLDSTTVHQSAASDTIQYLGVLPDVFPEPKEMVSDTLPQIQQTFFVSQDTISLTRYHSMREFAPGMEGNVLVQDPCGSDAMISIVLVCTFVILYILSHSRKYIHQRFHDFFALHESGRKFIFKTEGDAHSMGVLILQTIIFCGIFCFGYFIHSNKALSHSVPPLMLLSLYIISSFLYYLFKTGLYSFLGWVFFDKRVTDTYLESYSTLIILMGFLIFPFVLLIVFSYISYQSLVIISLLLIIFAKILILYKWIKLFSHNFFRHFLLILYFCALEIIPCFLFYESMIQMNYMLIKNF